MNFTLRTAHHCCCSFCCLYQIPLPPPERDKNNTHTRESKADILNTNPKENMQDCREECKNMLSLDIQSWHEVAYFPTEERRSPLPASSTSAHKRHARSIHACSWTERRENKGSLLMTLSICLLIHTRQKVLLHCTLKIIATLPTNMYFGKIHNSALFSDCCNFSYVFVVLFFY